MKLVDAYRTDDPVIDRCTFVFDEVDPPGRAGNSGNAELPRMNGAGLTDDEKETLIDAAIYSPVALKAKPNESANSAALNTDAGYLSTDALLTGRKALSQENHCPRR